MILISDSGSTKTDWLLTDGSEVLMTCNTQGINPFMQSSTDINHILRTELQPQLPADSRLTTVHFYGAGCKGPQCSIIKNVVENIFPDTAVHVDSDMLCAAQALCGHTPGIACILGTGANSCHFDGTKIIDNISPLGYILGDEGSGAYLGKSLIARIFKRLLPQTLTDDFIETYNLGIDAILHSVYKEPLANRFLASFVPFLKKHEHHPAIDELLAKAFDNFFHNNILAYRHPELPVCFVGGVAKTFAAQLSKSANRNGLTIGPILRAPLENWKNLCQQ